MSTTEQTQGHNLASPNQDIENLETEDNLVITLAGYPTQAHDGPGGSKTGNGSAAFIWRAVGYLVERGKINPHDNGSDKIASARREVVAFRNEKFPQGNDIERNLQEVDNARRFWAKTLKSGHGFNAQQAMDWLQLEFGSPKTRRAELITFASSDGSLLAFDPGLNPRHRRAIMIFVESQPLGQQAYDYPPGRDRNPFLDQDAPELASGRQAYAVLVSSEAQLRELCLNYRNKPSSPPHTSVSTIPIMPNAPLNQILYGPPGTGKTYATIEKALAILEPDFVGDRSAQKARFDACVAAGTVSFVTFHQSFSYEDFVEGIRAEVDEDTKQLSYAVEDGVFKLLCQTALQQVDSDHFSQGSIDLNGRKIWKISLGQAAIDNDVYQACIDQGLALLGFGGNTDLTNATSRADIIERMETARVHEQLSGYPIQALETFILKIKIGDILVVSEGNRKFRAIGQVTGEYIHVPPVTGHYSQARPVRWLRVYQEALPYQALMRRTFIQKSLYHLGPDSIDRARLAQLLAPVGAAQNLAPRVLIIDEINRGNISRIFGELITLIEPNKRAGRAESLSVTLPYSKVSFSVPDNVYLLGTMNTSDRSLAGLDLALRRRFVFEELPPRPELLGRVGDIDLQAMLRIMNQRIEVLLDRDHLLGHAYLINISSMGELKQIFQRQILPLLQEYFFEDWEKIALVLNDQRKENRFCFLHRPVHNLQQLFGDADSSQGSPCWSINPGAFDLPESYTGIYLLT